MNVFEIPPTIVFVCGKFKKKERPYVLVSIVGATTPFAILKVITTHYFK